MMSTKRSGWHYLMLSGFLALAAASFLGCPLLSKPDGGELAQDEGELTRGGGVLVVDPSSLLFGVVAQTAYNNLHLRNDGDAALVWGSEADAAWLTLEPLSGELAPDERTEVRVACYPEQMPQPFNRTTILLSTDDLAFTAVMVSAGRELDEGERVSEEGEEGEASEGEAIQLITATVRDLNTDVSLVFGEANGDKIVVLAEKNADGTIACVTGAAFLNEFAEGITVEMGPDGLPSVATIDGWTFFFSNYGSHSVDVRAISPEATSEEKEACYIAPDLLSELRAFNDQGITGICNGGSLEESRKAQTGPKSFFGGPLRAAAQAITLVANVVTNVVFDVIETVTHAVESTVTAAATTFSDDTETPVTTIECGLEEGQQCAGLDITGVATSIEQSRATMDVGSHEKFRLHSGANLPWLHYGWDMGEHPWGGCPDGFSANVQALDEHFSKCTQHGIELVRVFLFSDLRTGIDVTEDAIRVQERAYDDMDALLESARRHNLKLLPVLLDFKVADGVLCEGPCCDDCDPPYILTCPEGTTQTTCGCCPYGGAPVQVGESPWLLRPSQRSSLIAALREFVDTYRDDEAVYAWDVFNEPEWIWEDAGILTEDEVVGFVIELVEEIRNLDGPSPMVTLGSGNRSYLEMWSRKVELSFYQFHHYDEFEEYIALDEPVDTLEHYDGKDVLVGELEPVDIRGKLGIVEDNNYFGALFWSLNATDGHHFGDSEVDKYAEYFDVTASTNALDPQSAFAFSDAVNCDCAAVPWTAPFTVSFSDRSSAGTSFITDWLWDFGDGGTSHDQNPEHTYLQEGEYTVSLTVTTPLGSHTSTRKKYVTVGPGLSESDVTPGEMVSIAAGTFEMGDPWDEGYSSETPVHDVTLSAYEIGKYEVTNQEYADVLNWANGRGYLDTASTSTASAFGQELLDVDASYCQITWNGSQFVVDTREGHSMADHPVVDVSWYGAAAYCNWLSADAGLQACYDTSTWAFDSSRNGYHLPTEAQWERAAAWNGSYHYRYGNGSDSISCASANYHDGNDYCNPLGLSGYPYTSPVGYYAGASSPAGCFDMSGNVWEWCNDWWLRDYTSSPVTHPEGPSTGSGRLLRGGSWDDHVNACRSASRYYLSPDYSFFIVGFRVSRTP